MWKLSTENQVWFRVGLYAYGHAALVYLLYVGNLWVIALAFAIFAIGGFAVSAYAHRGLAHGSVVFKSVFLERVMMVLTVGSAVGSPLGWAAVHRMHHAYLDTDKDPHSPWRIGFWRSYFHLWEISPTAVPFKFLSGLTKEKFLLWVHWNSFLIVIVFHLIPILLFGWVGLAWGAAMAIGVHAMGFTNAVNHWASEPKKIRSSNLWWWQWGENCHEFHHDKPRSYSFGNGISDPTARVLELMEKLKLVEIRR